MSAPALSTPAQKTSLWEDLVDIFYAPAAVFARRRDGRYGLAMLVCVALMSTIFTFSRPLMQPIFDRMSSQQEQKMREQNPQLTDEQIGRGRQLTEKFSTGPIGAVSAVVGQAVTIFVLAFVIWIAGKLFGSVADYGHSTVIATFAMFPRLLGSLVASALLFVTDASSLTSMASMTISPARFLDPESSPVLLALLGRLDLFVLWGTALIAIGLVVLGKLTRTWAISAAVLVWVVASLSAVLTALRST